MSDWTFLTNHGHVIVFLTRTPDARVRDIAEAIGITERAAQRIISDLVEAGYVTRTRDGRRNKYSFDSSKPLRHPIEEGHDIGELIESLSSE
ncbi:MAG: winged helix-turn-helix transcriptional regulator [Thermoleophilaceae bacterium]|nr:winged helix-turn-helix transcriptional regulator [Thermoleophilaceae bacterium]